MRFETLFLRAFGPFTDEVLDLSGGAPGGLHVVYGPNEAGKSTSLRAVSSFLFGMPHSSQDAHLHPSNRLNIGAVLENEGHRYELTRLKRRKDSLVDAEGSPMNLDPLPALLGNLDERSFSSRFGLDQSELERGAEALLGGSEQGLFAAGTAGAEARRVLDSLEKKSSEIYLPRGKVPRLNRAVLDYESAAREAKRAERPPEKWLEQERAYRDAQAHVLEIREVRGKVRTELRRLNRLRSLMSDLSAYQEVDARLTSLGPVTELGENAGQERRDAEQRFAEAQVEARRMREELASFEAEFSELPPESRIIEVDDDQLSLSTRVGTALSARKDMPKRTAALLEQARQIATHLADLGRRAEPGRELELARDVLPSAQTIGSVARLLTQRGEFTAEANASARALQKILAEQKRQEEQAGDPPAVESLEALEGALSDAQHVQNLAASLQQDEERRADCEVEVGQLRASLGTIAELEVIEQALVSPDESNRRIASVRECLRRQSGAEVELTRLSRKREGVQARLAESGVSELPSEEKLMAARESRDSLFVQLEDRETTGPSRGRILKELRGAVIETDALSDRLRREADRVAEAAALLREQRSLESEEEIARREVESAAGEVHAMQVAHRESAKLLGVDSVPPLESAEAWFGSLRELSQAGLRLQALSALIQKKEKRIRVVALKLRDTLSETPPGTGLAGLIALATRRLREGHQLLDRQRNLKEARLRLAASRDEAELRRREATRALEAWEAKWARAVAPLGLEADVSVERAQEALFTLERLGRLVESASTLETRIAGMERDTKSLAEDVRRVAARHAPELLELDPVEAAVELQEAIRAARRNAEERARLKKLVGARRAALSQVESRGSTAANQLEQLRAAAGVASVEELPRAEERAQELRQLRHRHRELTQSIRDASEGAAVEELLEEAKPWQGATRRLVDRVDDLDEQNHELEETLRAAESDAEGKRLGLDTYRSEDVVVARQAVSHKEAEARAALREYLVLKTAHTLLKQQVESYAEQFAGPIAGRAGTLFERLTLGRYAGLKVGVGEKTLRCVRGGEELEVNQLSRGTRAQLYFALRLASLEHYFADQPAVPLVFDDLFVEFDDDRTTAAFEVLSEMAEKVQVLYFTHLARDVEAAHNAVPAELLFTHRLSAAPGVR